MDYVKDIKRDPRYGQFGTNVFDDYLDKAEKFVRDSYGDVEVLLGIPDLVCRLPEEFEKISSAA